MPALDPTGSATSTTDSTATSRTGGSATSTDSTTTKGPRQMTRLRFVPRPDPVLAQIGHDPRSDYAERFWLATLGPSALWILRLLAHGFDAAPAGFTVDAAQFSRSLGLGERTGNHSTLFRSLDRLTHFAITRQRVTAKGLASAPVVFEVTTRLRWLDGNQLRRLPATLRTEHELWEKAFDCEHPVLASTRRGAVCARSLSKSKLSLDAMAVSLERIGIEPELAVELAHWALQSRRDAAQLPDRLDLVSATAPVSPDPFGLLVAS